MFTHFLPEGISNGSGYGWSVLCRLFYRYSFAFVFFLWIYWSILLKMYRCCVPKISNVYVFAADFCWTFLSLIFAPYVLRLTVFRRFDSVIEPLTEPLFDSTMYRLANSKTTIKNHLIFTSFTIVLYYHNKFSNSIPMKYYTDLNSITFERTLIQFHCSGAEMTNLFMNYFI